jgi:(heptosyl)LPS beta-1,4-glucosyltransferase
MEETARRPITAVLIAYNEADRIADCLASLNWVDEIVVVDSGSSDSTREIARRYTERVYDIPWRGFGPQKQSAVELASHDMVLVVDCDERVTPELAEEIVAILADRDVQGGYSVPRRTFLGRTEIRHCGWYPDRTVRLFDRTRGRFSDDPVHERVIVEGAVGQCRNDLLHYSFAGIDDMLTKMRHYTDIAARHLFEKGRRCRLTDLTLRPLFAFFKTFILRAGFLDGVAGLTVAAANSMSVFIKYRKLRELETAGE